MRQSFTLPVALVVSFAALWPVGARAQSGESGVVAGPTEVILVRHAEKAPVPGDDPPLSAAGKARAQALAAALRDAGVSAVVATPFRRTSETAAPLASARGLEPEIVPLARTIDAHAANVAAAVRRHAGEVVLVVGHSNTIPAIIAALGGPRLPDLCDSEYGDLFVLVLEQPNEAHLVQSHYGAADPPRPASCAGMTKR